MIIEIDDNAVITIEGIRMSIVGIEEGLRRPVEDALFSVKREERPEEDGGPTLTFTYYRNIGEAETFFKKLAEAEAEKQKVENGTNGESPG